MQIWFPILTDGLDRLGIWDEYAQTQKEDERIVSLITI